MRNKYAIALVPSLVASGMIAGCASGPGPTAAELTSNALTCSTVVDSTGYRDGPLSVGLAIAELTEMQLTGGSVSIPRGRPSAADTSMLDTMSVELVGYSGSKLSSDATAFVIAEQNYNPEGPVETAYAGSLDGDISALQGDCPAAAALGQQWRAVDG
jgi:hypothetical protein